MIETLCGNHKTYESLLQWLESFNYSEHMSVKSCVFVIGSACIGKTYSVKKICEHLDLFVYEIDSHNCYDAVQFRDMIYKACTSSLIQNLENTDKKKVLVIDDFDVLYAIDKSIKVSLMKILDSAILRNIPIICICNNETYKKLGNTNGCICFELQPADSNEIKRLLKRLNIKPAKIKQLLENSDCNVGRIFELLHRGTIFNYSYSDANYDMTYLYNSPSYNRNIIISIVASDIWQIPLRFHENLIVQLKTKVLKTNDLHKIYIDFLDSLCIYDLFIHKNNIDSAIDIFASSLYGIMKARQKKGNISSMNKFSKILSYLSLQKKQNKISYNSGFPFYQLGNYHTYLLDRKFICFN